MDKQQITFSSWEEAQAFLQQYSSPGRNAEDTEVVVEENIVLRKFDGEVAPEDMDSTHPVEVIEVTNIIKNGELISSDRREVK